MNIRFSGKFSELKTLNGKYQLLKKIDLELTKLSDFKEIVVNLLSENSFIFTCWDKNRRSVRYEVYLEKGYAEGCDNIQVVSLFAGADTEFFCKKADSVISNYISGKYK